MKVRKWLPITVNINDIDYDIPVNGDYILSRDMFELDEWDTHRLICFFKSLPMSKKYPENISDWTTNSRGVIETLKQDGENHE